MGMHAVRTVAVGVLLAGAVGLVSGVPASALAALGSTVNPSTSTVSGIVRHGHATEAGVQVTVTGAGTTRSATTDSGGRYSFGDLTPGSYLISAGGYGNSADHVAEFAPVQRTVRLVAGAVTHATLHVTVGARITASFARSAEAGYFTWLLKRGPATAAVLLSGSSVATGAAVHHDIVISGLPAGTYTLQAFDDAGKHYASATVKLKRGQHVKPKRLRAKHRTLTLTGFAVAGATVSDGATPGFPWPAVDTADRHGAYALHGLVPGTYTVTEVPAGGAAVSGTVAVSRGHLGYDFSGSGR